MPWWIPLAAAAIPAAIDIGKSIFGGKKDKREAEAADASRRTLASMLQENAQQNPMQSDHVKAAMGEMARRMDLQSEKDEQAAARYGLAGSEYEIAQAGNRQSAYTDAFLGLTQQAGQEKARSLQQAMMGQGMMDQAVQAKKANKTNKSSAYAQMAQGIGMAFGGSE